MLLNQASAATTTSILDPVSAANTAAATSGSAKWLDVRAYDGEILVTQVLGAITGTIAGKLQSATDANGTGAADITGYTFPVNTTNQSSKVVVDPEESRRRLPGIRGHHRDRSVSGGGDRGRQAEDRLTDLGHVSRRPFEFHGRSSARL
jgi:hypothetical protein